MDFLNCRTASFLPATIKYCREVFKESVQKKFPERKVIQHVGTLIQTKSDSHRTRTCTVSESRTLSARMSFWWIFQFQANDNPLAAKTGNMTLRPFSVVHSILYDNKKERQWVYVLLIPIQKRKLIFYAKLIFVNAAAINTNLILVNSKSNRFPNGLGNDSGVLGKYVAFTL